MTDGPGDGGRDIHSVDAKGQKHLSQCKFHKNILQACTSQELAELPMAMVKLGYEGGTFVTNARISPQGKREFLDNYGQLRLEFLDGGLVANEVLGKALLKAAWFDGKEISRINSQLVLPVIVRRHEDDVPINPLAYFARLDIAPLVADLVGRFPGLSVSIRGATATTEDFRRYRAPKIPTMDEGAIPGVRVAELVFAGPIALGDLERVEEEACRGVLGWLGLRMNGLTVVVGKSYIVPTSGESAGAKTLTGREGVSFVQTPHSTDLDLRWFDWQRPGWTNKTDARVSEADWIRLSNAELNVCLSYEIEAQAVGGVKSGMDVRRSHARRGWSRSVFALVPSWTQWTQPIPVPDDKVGWKWDSRQICGWFHWSLRGSLIVFPSQGEEEDPFAGPPEESEDQRLAEIRKHLMTLPDVDVVSPDQARHMVALVGNDPFEEFDEIRYRTAEVVEYPEDLPRPLIPQARRFQITVAWTDSAVGLDAFRTLFPEAKLPLVAGVSGVSRWEVDGPYLVLNVDLVHARLAELPTQSLLENFETAIKHWCSLVEGASNAKRATFEYWKQRFGVELGRGWNDTGKTYVWMDDGDGSVSPVSSEEFLGGICDEES